MIAGTEMTFALELYKTKLENDILNQTILKMIHTLEENEDSYIDTFPVAIEPFRYEFENEDRKKTWLQKYGLSLDTSAESAFFYFKDKYEIKEESVSDSRKIIAVRYRITSEGYSSTKSLTISNSISRKSALIFDEQNIQYPGIDVVTSSKRSYAHGNLGSHILRICQFD